MSNLTRFETDDGIELVIDTETGESFATISGYARMSGKDKTTISRRLTSVALETPKTAEILTSQGLRTVTLIPAKLVFKWLLNDNPDLAEIMGEAGSTVFLHQLAGYKVSSTVIAPKPASSNLAMARLMLEELEQHEVRLSAVEVENIELKKQLVETEIKLAAQKVETEKQLAAQKIEIDDNASELERFKNGHGTYFSIAGWCAKHGFRRSLDWMNAQGRKAASLCKSKGIKKEKVPDPRWGSVGAYPDTVLSELTWNDEK